MTARILVVDDDRDIRTLLAGQLASFGYNTIGAANGREMTRALARGGIDLIVLDLNLPGTDGLTLCRELRAGGSELPVIILTARGDPIDRVLGLEMGADDYLGKPFEPRELLARIRSVLRRTKPRPGIAIAARKALFDRWTFDLEQRHLTDRDGRTIILSGAEYRLLRVLVENPERALKREQLASLGAAPPGEEMQDRAIDLQVSRLRRKLGDGDAGCGLIRTIRHEGYMLAAPVILS